MNRAQHFVALFVGVLFVTTLGACKKETPEQMAKPLESSDPSAREQAAKKLQARYASNPESLGDHGEEYWKKALELAKTDKIVCEHLVGASEHLPRNEGPGDPKTQDLRLDRFWIAEVRFEGARCAGYDRLERSVKVITPPAPPLSFNGHWKTYYLNGAVASEADYSPNRREERRFYDDGKPLEESVYTRDTLIPIGLLVHYFPNGKKAYEQPYANGKMNGVYRTWYPSGAIKYEWPHVEGKREGKWKAFKESGELELCQEFKADVEVARDCK